MLLINFYWFIRDSFMAEKEGVIKYQLDHLNISIDQTISITEINAWRTLLFKLQLIGRISERYEGYGFGNISQRINRPNSDSVQFCISGTQTGGIESLSRQHYSQVLLADPIKNCIRSKGETKPSSEALSHASVYLQDNNIQSVIHVHSPEIWNNTQKLELPFSDSDIAYGTPEMAIEVERLMQTKQLKEKNIFCMLGHQDGVIAYSDSIEKTAHIIIKYFAKAIALEQNSR
jgi:ribulose-5-phosphate 4-epimerase/fuculose-1-phosphate aldolase